MSLIAELKRRKVAQWTLGYAAGAWALLQAIGFMVESYDWPHTVSRIAIVVVAIGFLVTLVLAWYHGERGAQRLSRNEMLLLTVLLALGGGLAWRTAHAPQPAQSLAAAAPVSGASLTAIPDIANDPSIAVLPFVNMSSDKEQEYFSDGISEELLNLLAKVPKLRVIARTSSFSFKGKEAAIPDIARALNVAAILEGSVRKSGDTVRITVQLIRASDSSHMWSETYDRKLDDIFKVQDEIAATVVAKLKITLMGMAPTSKVIDPKAFDEYLRGRAFWNQRTEASVREALVHFQKATRIEPDFALGFAGIADSYLILGVHGFEPPREMIPAAKAAAQHAMQLDPSAGEPHATLGDILFHYDWDWAGSDREHEQAIKLAPGYATAYQWSAEALQLLGDIDAAIARLRHARTLDPLSMIIRVQLAQTLADNGQRNEAIAELREALVLGPEFPRTRSELARQLLFAGRGEEALVEARRLVATNPDYLPGLATLGLCLGRTGHADEARALLVKLDGESHRHFVSSLELARISAGLGDSGTALRYLEQAVAAREGFLPFIGGDDEFDFLHGEPRYQALARQIGLPRTIKSREVPPQ
jgi:adenylate cyclase